MATLLFWEDNKQPLGMAKEKHSDMRAGKNGGEIWRGGFFPGFQGFFPVFTEETPMKYSLF